MTAPVLGDVLGPRGRQRVLVASIASSLLVALFVVVAFRRLSESGQLAGDKWVLFRNPAILRFLGKGLLTTLELAAASMALAIFFGSLLALGRLARNAPTRWLTGGWVEVFRAVPLLLMIYFSARGLPRLGVDLPGFWYVVAGLTLYNSAVLAEIFRSGIRRSTEGRPKPRRRSA